MEIFIFCLIFVLFLFVYFIPSIIAWRRKKRNAVAILMLNLFLGVTFFGWVIALIWAVLKEKSDSISVS